MSKLLARAEADYNTAKYLLSPAGNPTNDEMLTDIAAYHTQQAIEKALKYKIEMLGMSYKKNHDLVGLIQVLENNNFHVDKELRDRAYTISNWEAESRYSDSFSVVKSSVEDALKLYEQLRDTILRSTNPTSISYEERVNNTLRNMGISKFTYEDLKKFLPSTELDDDSLHAVVQSIVNCLS